jgi:hemolysin activation/secretion protein
MASTWGPFLWSRWPAALWATAIIGLAGPAGAQPIRTPELVPSASELAPPIRQPDTADPRPRRDPPRELGKPEDDIRLDVRAYAVDDDAPARLRAALPALTQPYTGPQRGFEDLARAAAEVTRYLQRDLGYYLGYAYLPEQTPADGVVRIAVLEGRLDRVELNWRDGLPVKREVVAAYLARLRPGSVLRVRDVERVIFLVNDLRGLSTRFEVRAGSQPGTATLVVTPLPEAAWAGKVEADTNGSKALGEYRLSGLLQMNSPFGRGDGFTANVLASHTGGLGFALLGYTTPVGSDGFKLGTSVSGVRYQLDKERFPLDLNGIAATVNAYGLYPVVRARNLNLFTLLSLEHKQYEDRNLNSRARKGVDAVVLGTTGDFRDSLLGGGVNTYELGVAAGQLKYPDGRNPALDDDERYTKLTYGYTRLQDLVTGRALLYAALRGQHALNNLDTTEQFRIGGPDGVRAFATGEGTGDIGAVATLELRVLPPEAWLGRVAREMVFSVFADGGYVQYRYRPRGGGDLNARSNHARFGGAGIGLAWVRPNEFAFRLSVARPVAGEARNEDDRSKVRVHLQAAMLFN